MSTSEKIRSLAREGRSVSEIAQELGIGYRHAYNVVKAASNHLGSQAPIKDEIATRPPATVADKPPLTVDALVAGGFAHSGRWILSDEGEVKSDRPLPWSKGVYAFVLEAAAVYVGVATTGLAIRLKAYCKPGPSQSVNQRINERIKSELQAKRCVEIYAVTPEDLEWRGFPVSGCVGLEHGLIMKFTLPWNKLHTSR